MLKRLLATFLLAMQAGWAGAETFVIGPDSDAAKPVIAKIVSVTGARTEGAVDEPGNVIVAIGPDAVTSASLQFKKSHIIAAFVGEAAIPEGVANLSAVVSDPSPAALADVIRDRGLDRVGMVTYGNADERYAESLIKEGVEIRPLKTNPHDLYRSLSRIYETESVDALLITNNRPIFNATSLKVVLESLFRKRIQAVSAIDALHGKGASITVAPTDAQIISKVAEAVSAIEAGIETERIIYPPSTIQVDAKLSGFYRRHP